MSPGRPPRRRRRRRWRHGGGGPIGKPIAPLPAGARLFTYVKLTEKVPLWKGRHRWCWAEAVSMKSRESLVLRLDDGTEITKGLTECFVSAAGEWRRVRAAGHTYQQKYWWAGNNSIETYRLATQLEVALYLQNDVGTTGVNFVPHADWRLLDETMEFVGPDLGDLKLQRVYLARPEPPSDEEWADRLEKEKGKRKVKELAHAKKMLALWQGKAKVVAKRLEKWSREAARLEKKVTAAPPKLDVD